MESIFDYLDFVNKQIAFHDQKAIEYHGTKREWAHKKTANKFQGLKAEIEGLRGAVILRQPEGRNPLALAPADVKDLPPELIEQLVNLPDNDKLENDILEIINDAGGTLLLDHLLIALYKKSGEIHQRNLLVSKLYRMNKKGLVFSAPAKKGAYTTIKPADEEGDIDDQTGQLDLTPR